MPLNNSQYQAIMRQYDQKQYKSRHILEERQREVYKKIPTFEELEASIAECAVSQTKKKLSGDEKALVSLKNELNLLSETRDGLLEAYGYPKSYLEPVYECAACQDTGYIGNEKCACFQQAVINMLYTQSNIQEVLKSENFSNFTFHYHSDKEVDPATGVSARVLIQKAYTVCQKFLDEFDTSYSNLLFYGTVGTGKTFLSNCIAKELIETAHSVIYLSSFQLFDMLARETFQNDRYHSGENTPEFVSQYLFDCDLLIIDDLGTELTNTFVSSQLFLCINERHLRKKSTIISTNLTMDRLIELYSERTFSRISSNYQMLKFAGEDIRIKKKRRKSLTS